MKLKIKVFNPDSRPKVAWEILILLLTVSVTIISPLTFIFHLNMSLSYRIFDFVITIMFILDILIQFNTGYYIRHELITDRKKIARRYLKSWFILDLGASIPFILILNLKEFTSLNRFLQFFRLSRIFKIFGSSRTLKRAKNLSFVNPAMLRLFMLIFWLMIVAHLIACGWIYIGGTGYDPVNDIGTVSRGQIYLESFYWTITTLTTIGYGDITPTTTIQYMYVILIMLMGAGLYGFIIGNIANIIAKMDVTKTQFMEKVDNISNFLKYRNIPNNLQKRIHDYYDYLWESRRGFEESNLLDDLPISLKTQVSFFLNRDIIEKVPIFKEASRGFIRDIILNLKPAIYTPGDAIITYGEIGYEMYFISKGEVDVLNEDETITYATLTSGQFFGEIALLSSTPRTATVRARDYCDVYILDKDTFNQVLQRYPRFAKSVEEMSAARKKELGIEDEDDELIEVIDDSSAKSEGPVPERPLVPVYQILEDGVTRISWIPAAGAETYEIIRRVAGEDAWKRLAIGLAATDFLDIHTPKGEVAYKVRGINKYGGGKWSPSLIIRIS